MRLIKSLIDKINLLIYLLKMYIYEGSVIDFDFT